MTQATPSRPDARRRRWRDLRRALTLTWELTKRDVLARYRGSFGGTSWSLIQPLLMLAIYTIVFTQIIPARWPGASTTIDFAMLLFSGLLMHSVMVETIVRAPTLITSTPNFVKRIVFPLDLLPVAAVGTSLFHYLLGVIALCLVLYLVKGSVPGTVVLLPLVVGPMLLMALGFAWFLAGIGVFVRDVVHVVGLAGTVLLFLAPIVYPLQAVPESWRAWLYLNPLTVPVEEGRAVTILGVAPDWRALALYTVVAAVVALAGYLWFRRVRPQFADLV